MFRTASATELCFHSRCNDPVSRAKYTPRLFEFAGWFNRVAYWVARQVVTHEDHNERVRLVQTFIMVAHQCMVWHNYNTCFEIVTGLMLSPVQRLTSTWTKISSKYQLMLNQLYTIMSQRPNFKLYR
ncbi:ras GEF, partial [Ramicandelaber brevisporus]